MAVISRGQITLSVIEDGVSVLGVTEQYYLSTSKTTTADGSWLDRPPTWSRGKYLWVRSKVTYTSNKVGENPTYTAPYCDSSWEAIEDIKIGGVNLVDYTRSTPPSDFWKTAGWSSIKPVYDESEDALVLSASNGWQTSVVDISHIEPPFTVSFRYKPKSDNLIGLSLLMGVFAQVTYTPEEYIFITISDEEWASVSVTYTKAQPYFGLNIRGIDSQEELYEFYLRNLMIEYGNKRTYYQESPNDVKRNINKAQSVADAITAKAESEGWATKLTHIDANGIFTGQLSANTVTSIRVNASQITAGTIDTARLNTDALKSTLITASNINALTLDVVRGKIGGWSIESGVMKSSHLTLDSRNKRVVVYGASSSSTSGHRTQLYHNSDSDFGFYTSNSSGAVVAQFGTTNRVAGWNITSSYIYKNSVYLGSDGSIYNGTKWKLANDGSGLLANSNIKWDASGNVTFGSAVSLLWSTPISELTNSLDANVLPKLTKITSGGVYTGTLTASQITAGTISASRIDVAAIKASLITADNINALTLTSTKGKIGGWSITSTSIAKNSVSLGSDGTISNGAKWRLSNDGSGSLAAGNISWNSAGAVTFSSAVSMLWKSDIETAKASNFGYPYYQSIVINGEEDLYYPVIFKGGDQNIKRDILIRRAYNEQAPNSWYNSTHKGGLIALLKTNFGDWGGIGYSWEIYDLSETYSRMFAGAQHCGNSCMFAIFLRGGGTTGAKYHIYSDQAIVNDKYSPSPIPPAPQIAYDSDLMFNSGFAQVNAPAPRTLTEAVEKEIRSKRFIYLAQSSDNTLAAHPLTYIGSTGIYTGTLTANQVNAVAISASSITTGTLSADRIAAGSITASKLNATSIKSDIINTSYINGLTCTFTKGSIGGWSIGADNISTGNIGGDGQMPMQIRKSSTGSGYWYSGAYRPFGISMTWHKSANAGHIVIGQVASNGSSVKSGFVGIQMMSWDNQEYFCLSANYTRSGSKEVYNRIAGWAFDAASIWKNSVYLGSDGSIYNSSNKWRLSNDGSGRVANGNISWDASGNVTFSSAVSLKWESGLSELESSIDDNIYPKITKLTSTGIYTGTITANQITAGIIDAARIDVNSIKASILTATNINALTLTTSKGQIGGWNITSSYIYKNSVYFGSDGSIYNNSKWRFNNDGSGLLANGNVSWDSGGNIVAKNALFTNVRVQGSVRNPYVLNTNSSFGGDSGEELANFNNNDNVVVLGEGGISPSLSLPWTLDQSGRRISLINYKWGSTISSGYRSISAPTGKYFYEDGVAKETIRFSREMIELIGYGDDQTLFGWIVLNRLNLMPEGSYGKSSKVLAYGKVSGSSSSPTIVYHTFDGSGMSVSRLDTGKYRVSFPSSWGLSSTNAMIMLTGYGYALGSSSYPIKATVTAIYSSSFYGSTSDGNTANDGSFYFQIMNMDDWAY